MRQITFLTTLVSILVSIRSVEPILRSRHAPLKEIRFSYKKNVNRDSHIAFSPIPQSYFFEELRSLILASSQRKLRGDIEFLKFDITIEKINKFKFV